MEHLTFLIQNTKLFSTDIMQMFLKMKFAKNGFHFEECDWVTSTCGPDTCKCIWFLVDFRNFLEENAI